MVPMYHTVKYTPSPAPMGKLLPDYHMQYRSFPEDGDKAEALNRDKFWVIRVLGQLLCNTLHSKPLEQISYQVWL